MYMIEIKKDQLPYKTQIEINGDLFILGFNYNIYDERIYCTLYDVDNNILAEDEPITMGNILFGRLFIDNSGNLRNGFPKAVMIPNYYDVNKKDKMSYNNINEWALYVEEI